MATSKPSQPPLFETGESEPTFDLASGAFSTPTLDTLKERAVRYKQGGVALHTQVMNGAGPSTSSPGATPASHSHSPGSDWARRMTAISGRRCAGSLTSAGPVSSWLRTLAGTSRWASTLFWLSWKRTATPAGRSLYRLVPSTPSTGATGFGSWPTATAVDRPNEGNVRMLRAKVKAGEISHEEATAMLGKSPMEAQGKIPAAWPTPNVAGGGNMCELTPHKGHYLRPSGEKAHLGLDQAVRMWPTNAVKSFPTPRAQMGALHQPSADRPHETGGLAKRLEVEVGRDVEPRTGLKLHGRWTLSLMGYPPDWCDDLPPDPLSPT